MPLLHRQAQPAGALCLATFLLYGCASTTVTLQPTPQAPVCDSAASALVLWAPQWRPDQKDVANRDGAASTGLDNFLGQSGCFASAELRRVANLTPSSVGAQLRGASRTYAKVVGIEVRELGPIVKLLSSAAIVEGGTEVVLRVAEYSQDSGAELREFTVHWQNGGAGVIKGVASLSSDIQAALSAGLKPVPIAR